MLGQTLKSLPCLTDIDNKLFWLLPLLWIFFVLGGTRGFDSLCALLFQSFELKNTGYQTQALSCRLKPEKLTVLLVKHLSSQRWEQIA